MKTKFVKGVLALIGAATLLAGCSTANQGAQGNDTQTGEGGGSGGARAMGNGGANGTISRTNPFGIGPGTGNTPGTAH